MGPPLTSFYRTFKPFSGLAYQRFGGSAPLSARVLEPLLAPIQKLVHAPFFGLANQGFDAGASAPSRHGCVLACWLGCLLACLFFFGLPPRALITLSQNRNCRKNRKWHSIRRKRSGTDAPIKVPLRSSFSVTAEFFADGTEPGHIDCRDFVCRFACSLCLFGCFGVPFCVSLC